MCALSVPAAVAGIFVVAALMLKANDERQVERQLLEQGVVTHALYDATIERYLTMNGFWLRPRTWPM